MKRNKKSNYYLQKPVISATLIIGSVFGGIIGYFIGGNVFRIEITFLGALIGGITGVNLKFIFNSLRKRKK